MVTMRMTALLLAAIISVGGQENTAQELAAREPPLSVSLRNDIEGAGETLGFEPCRSGNYRQLTDSRREVSKERDRFSAINDDDLRTGWYRFQLHYENAVMPTSCVPERHCFTDVPLWLDLQGQAMPEAGQEIKALACGPSYSRCCFWDFPARVRNCGDFYIYFLERTEHCNLFPRHGYCMVLENRTQV